MIGHLKRCKPFWALAFWKCYIGFCRNPLNSSIFYVFAGSTSHDVDLYPHPADATENIGIDMQTRNPANCTGAEIRSFGKGLAGRGVGARRSPLCQRFRPLFCALFPMPPLEEGEHNSEERRDRAFGRAFPGNFFDNEFWKQISGNGG